MTSKNKLGQYFTTSNVLKEKLFEFILNKPENILEPSIGRGDLVSFVASKLPDVTFDSYEIDKTIKLLDGIENVVYCDFLNEVITKKYKTIIGNPPFIRTKTGNLYIDFTKKCYELLENNGELIFIVPSDFLKLTSASKLLDTMMKNGTFTHIYHPTEENLFANASINIIIFRYCKNKKVSKKTLYNDDLLYITNSIGMITFGKEANIDTVLFSDYFDIYVGLVSGKESVYKNEEFGNITVLTSEEKSEKYIFIQEYPTDNEELDKYLLSHKKSLIQRGIRSFNETNWFEWGAPRNLKTIKENIGKDCIYVNMLTRKANIAFVGKITYFGGSLIMLKPKKTCDLDKIIAYMNSEKFKTNFTFSGRCKIGHRQISNSFIPNECLPDA